MSETINQILLTIRAYRTCSEAQLRRYIKDLGIQTIGARQCPQRYPASAAAQILKHLGYENNGTNGTREPKSARVATMPELRAARERAKEGK